MTIKDKEDFLEEVREALGLGPLDDDFEEEEYEVTNGLGHSYTLRASVPKFRTPRGGITYTTYTDNNTLVASGGLCAPVEVKYTFDS